MLLEHIICCQLQCSTVLSSPTLPPRQKKEADIRSKPRTEGKMHAHWLVWYGRGSPVIAPCDDTVPSSVFCLQLVTYHCRPYLHFTPFAERSCLMWLKLIAVSWKVRQESQRLDIFVRRYLAIRANHTIFSFSMYFMIVGSTALPGCSIWVH